MSKISKTKQYEQIAYKYMLNPPVGIPFITASDLAGELFVKFAYITPDNAYHTNIWNRQMAAKRHIAKQIVNKWLREGVVYIDNDYLQSIKLTN